MDIHFGKCPYCKSTISKLRLEKVELGTGPLGTDRIYNGVSYHCPACQAVLSVEMDPISLRADLVDAVAKRLR